MTNDILPTWEETTDTKIALKEKVTIGFLDSLCSKLIWDVELYNDQYITLEQGYSYSRRIICALFWFYGLGYWQESKKRFLPNTTASPLRMLASSSATAVMITN